MNLTIISPALAVEINLVNSKEKPKVINVAVLIDGQNEVYDSILDTYKKEISNLLKPNYEVNFAKIEYDNWTMADIKKKANLLIDNKNIDVIIGLGFLSTNYLSKVKTNKIVIKVFDYGTTAESVYNSKTDLPKEDIEMLYSQMKFKKLGIFVNEEYIREIPSLKQALESVKTDRYTITAIPVSSKTEDFSTIIPSDIDTAYITPLYNLSRDQIKSLYKALNDRKIVSFSTQGREAIEDGAFAALEIPNRHKRLARQTAQNILIALNDKTSTDRVVLPVVAKDAEVLINANTAKEIDAQPDWNVVLNAKIVKNVSSNNVFSLSTVLSKVINDNLELKEKLYAFEAAKDEKYAALSKFLPTVSLDMMYSEIDKDRAAASMGLFPQSAGSLGLGLRQVLFSDKLLTNLSVKNKLAKLSEEVVRQTDLNLQIHAAIEYVNYLKTQQLQKVQEEHIINTRANMAIAAEKGATADLERLNAYLALDRVTMLEYRNQLRIGKILLNRFMNRNQTEDFELKELTNDSPELFSSQFEISKYLDKPHKLALFEEELVKRALLISPELKQLDKAIAAKSREMKHYGLRPVLPDVVFDLQARNNINRNFEGYTVAPTIISGKPVAGFTPATEDVLVGAKKSYQLAFLSKWDIFNGGEDQIRFLKARNELQALHYKRESVREHIEQEVRTKVNTALTGHFKAKYAALAVEDAQRGFEEAQKNYKAGKIQLADLLYLQDKLLKVQKEAIISKSDFLIGLLWVQRAIGCVDFSNTNLDHQAWFNGTIKKMDELL